MSIFLNYHGRGNGPHGERGTWFAPHEAKWAERAARRHTRDHPDRPRATVHYGVSPGDPDIAD